MTLKTAEYKKVHVTWPVVGIPRVFKKLSVLYVSRRFIAAIKRTCLLPLYCDINLIYGLLSYTLESILVVSSKRYLSFSVSSQKPPCMSVL